jgi:hypothetical protein
LSKFNFCQICFPPDRPEYPDIFPDSPDFPEYPEKYPETPDLYLTVVKKFVIFRFDYSPSPSSRHLDPFRVAGGGIAGPGGGAGEVDGGAREVGRSRGDFRVKG